MPPIFNKAKSYSHAQHARNKDNQRATKPIDFNIGDYVLWATVDTIQKLGKLEVTWRGPFTIVDTVSHHVFTIQHLIDGKQTNVHASRLKFYRDATMVLTKELNAHVAGQGFLFDISHLVDIRYSRQLRGFETLVHWSGFEEVDRTWEPFTRLWVDIPQVVFHFLSTFSLRNSRNRAITKALTKQHHEQIKATAMSKPSMNLDSLLRQF